MQQVFKWEGGLQKNVWKKFGGWGHTLDFFLSKVTAYAFITIILLLFFFLHNFSDVVGSQNSPPLNY